MSVTEKEMRRIGRAFVRESARIRKYQESPYRSIDELGLPRDVHEEGPLDPGIANLIRVLNPLGLRTTGSCEGHIGDTSRGRRPYPWVLISGLAVSSWLQNSVNVDIAEFNKTSDVQ